MHRRSVFCPRRSSHLVNPFTLLVFILVYGIYYIRHIKWQNNGCVRLYCFHFSLGSLMFWLFNLLSIYGKKATNHLSMGIIVLEPDRQSCCSWSIVVLGQSAIAIRQNEMNQKKKEMKHDRGESVGCRLEAKADK